jgi:FixJ family two-component response regulator
MSGFELLKRIVGAASNTRVIMITGHGDIPTAVSAMKAGAFNFVEKPFDAEALLITIEEAFSCVDKDRYANNERRNTGAVRAPDKSRARCVRTASGGASHQGH